MRVSTDPRLPDSDKPIFSWERKLVSRLYEVFREHASAINGAAPVSTAPATQGRFLGEFVQNTNDYVEVGTAGSKYTLTGWKWNGTTWLEQRSLTGN